MLHCGVVIAYELRYNGIIMADTALKTAPKTTEEEAQNAASQKVGATSPAMRAANANAAVAPAAAGALVHSSGGADAPAVAVKSVKSITDSVTYQNNRKYILATLQTLQNNFSPLGAPNILRERFEINVEQQLAQFSRTHAKAYRATDAKYPDKLCVALVVEPYFPHRHLMIEALKGQQNPHLSELLDAGVVHVEAWGEARMVLFYEQPKGEKLSDLMADLMADKPFCNQSDVLKQVVAPIIAAIAKLHSLGVVHGGINPQNIYVHERNLTLWDCVAQPCGYDSQDIYEPVERLSADTNMRGAPTLEADIYAIAVLALDACGLLNGKKQFTAKQLYPAMLQKGAYNLLVAEEAITSSQLLDLTRGVLCDNPKERWGIEQINNLVNGKRYNLIQIGTLKETSRAFAFAGIEHITMRSLAFSYVNNWEQALLSIRDVKLVKWIDTLLQKNENLKEMIERMNQRAIRSTSKGKISDEIISKTISTLDPFGAIRTKQMAISATAVGQTLCSAFKAGDLAQQVAVREIIEAELAGFWRDLSSYNSAQLKWSPEQMRLLVQSSSVGFGMERALYELNQTLPCLSRTYARYHSLSAKHMMLVLESSAKNHADDKLYDKHMLAFLAARAGIVKDVKIKVNGMQSSTELQAIMLLSSVQEKLKMDSLPALSCWAALKITDIIEQFHGLDVRQAISRDMQAVLPRGRLGYLLSVLYNKEHIARDVEGHSKAVRMFGRNNVRIKYYKDKAIIARKAEISGQKFALSLSVIMLLAVIYVVVEKYII